MYVKYKYESVADMIRENIRKGGYLGGELPGEALLGKEFGVGKITVYHALRLLAEEGLIDRVRKKGTFVKGAFGKTLSASSQVAMVMRHTGHYYGKLAAHIREELLKNSLFALPIDNTPDEPGKSRESIFTLLSSKLYGVIFDGDDYEKFPFLNNFPKVRSVVLHHFDASGDIPDRAVFADFEAAAYLATSHLAEKRRKRIVLCTHKLENFPMADAAHAQRHPLALLAKGYRKAMAEAGLEGDQIVALPDESRDMIRGLLARRQRPDAIVCNSDISAVRVVSACQELGLKLPEDLAVTGMYNTPWCEDCPVSLSSVSFEEAEIARMAVELLTTRNPVAKAVTVKPRLVIRESS